MSVWKTRDCMEAVTSLAMDGVFICAALSSQYVVYNMDKMTVTPLFPLDPAVQGSVVPNILRIDRDEFLVQGPGNLGMFVTSAGVAGRPPLQWSADVTNVTYAHPYLLCQGCEMISVYDINDQNMKQGLSYSGARFVGFFDGHILVATSNNVDILAPIPWHQQASSLLEEGHLEDAVNLAKDNIEGDVVRQKAGFMYLKDGKFDKARDTLLQGKTDVREVLSLFPGMLPSNSKFVRSDPPLHDIPDIYSINKQTEEGSPEQFLVFYLKSLMSRSGAYLDHCTEVHTALVKILTKVDPTQVAGVIKDDKSIIDFEDLAEFLENGNFHHFLATLNWKCDNEAAAIDIWSRVLTGEVMDDQFPGLEFFCRHLSLCSEELMFQHCGSALKESEEIGARIFMKARLDVDTEKEFINKVLAELTNYQKAKVKFLKFLVLDKSSQDEKHHTQLAMAFINNLKSAEKENLKENSANLSKLILTSEHLNANFLLQHLADTDLDYEKAILHGKLGQHDSALEILVNNLQNYQQAENYIDDIAANQKDLKSKLLFSLLNIYLHPTPGTNKEKFTSLAVELINSRASDMNGPKVIAALPQHWNIAIILPALKTFSRSSLHNQRMTSICKNLQRSKNIQLRAELMTASKDPVYIMTNNYCAICKKNFMTADSVVRYPNGVMVHHQCVTNTNICPVTGQVFKLENA